MHKVLVIYTGGTIGMVQDPTSGLFKAFDFDHLLSSVPELKRLSMEIDVVTLGEPIDSAEMTPKHWSAMATSIHDNYDSYDGFVILHGSDTMAYSASALSFMLKGLNKPVILTGSQLPIGIVRTDGKENLITAIEIAGARDGDRPKVCEVAIYFENMLYRGNRTYKHSAEYFSAFRSDNYPELAKAGVHINYKHSALKPWNDESLVLHTKMEEEVAILRMYPGISQKVVKSTLEIEGLKGVVLETFGNGNAITAGWFLNALRDAVARGVVVLNVTQCNGGAVEQGRYETSGSMNEIGVISGQDITEEAGLTKLMFVLANTKSVEEARDQLKTSLAGEMKTSE